MSTIDNMNLRLRGTGLSDGELTFAGLEVLAHALQLLSMRVGRHLTGQDGAGRSTVAVERTTELRLRGTSVGSTVLAIGIGEDDVLAEGLEHRTRDGIFEVFSGIAGDAPPSWTTAPIGEATVSLIEALASNSTECELTSDSGRHTTIRLTPQSASRSVWPVDPATPERRPGASVTGQLDLVDLRRSRFRIRDRAGSDIRLDQVVNANDAARLVGDIVTATGEATIGNRGQIVSLIGAVVEPTQLPQWTTAGLADAISGASPPPSGGIPGIDHDEVTEFLALIRE